MTNDNVMIRGIGPLSLAGPFGIPISPYLGKEGIHLTGKASSLSLLDTTSTGPRPSMTSRQKMMLEQGIMQEHLGH